MSSHRHVCYGVALLSVSMLMTELIFTRIFSVTIWYHFAFLAISVALFGTGVASLFLHLGQRWVSPRHTDAILAGSSLLFGLAIFLSEMVLLGARHRYVSQELFDFFSWPMLELLVVFCAAAAPFFMGGFAISLAMTRYAAGIHSLYAWDLLGAGFGCLLVIGALSVLGAPLALGAVALLPAVAALIFLTGPTASARRGLLRLGAAAFMALILALALTNPWTHIFEVRYAKGERLKDFNIVYNKWNAFSMVSVWKQEFFAWGLSPTFKGPFPEEETWNAVIDMCGLTPMIPFDGDFGKVGYLMQDLTAFPYHFRKAPERMCVIGAGGGKDVLAGLTAGARHVTAVEINPLVINSVMQGQFLEHTGRLYQRPDVEVHIEDGRTFIKGTREKFDMVQLSMVDTSAATAAGAYVLSENSLYTVDAFRDYLNHLNPGGMLTVSWGTMPRLAGGERLCSVARAALRERGADPARCVAVISTFKEKLNEGLMLHNVMIKPEPFTAEEIAGIKDTAEKMGFILTYVPGMPPSESEEMKNWIPTILATADDAALAKRMARWPLDVSPVTDDRPFFFYQNRITDIGDVLLQGRPSVLYGNGLFILSKIAFLSLAMVLLFFVIPFVFARRELKAGTGSALADLAYVACLGLGFMFVEISMIQRFVPFLGRPTYALAAVLFVLLCAGGAGSRLFGIAPQGRRTRWLSIVLLLLIGLVALVWVSPACNLMMDAAAPWPVAVRIALVAALLLPLGLLLGMPFPAGLAAVSRRAPTRIPWLWAVNSATSVLGSVGATLVAIHLGIRASTIVGVGFYALALALAWIVCHERAKSPA